jgi:hypothetical protein
MNITRPMLGLGNSDIFTKQKNSVIKEMKRDEILLKPNVCDSENFCGIP